MIKDLAKRREAPLISIIIPVYNSENYISDTILSCLNQSYQNIEIILINDGSTDKSEDIIRQFIDDNRVKYFAIKNVGACDARNFGISKAKGQLYQFLDSDDMVDVNKLHQQMNHYFQMGDDYIYSSRMGTVSGTNRTLDPGYELYQRNFTPQQYFETTLTQFGRYITTGSWLVPAKILKSTYGWDSNAGLNDDGEYFMRIILNSTGIVFCKEALFFYRRDVPNSLSKRFDSKEVYLKWLFSYSSYVKHFLLQLEPSIARKLGWKALSIYYCNSYPKYPDLLRQCKAQMSQLGYQQPSAHGGSIFRIVSKVLSTETALQILHFKNKLFNRNVK